MSFKALCFEAVGREAKREVRRKWCKEAFKFVLDEKTHEESYTEIDTLKGEFFTFGSLVKEYGGWQWEPAVVGAKIHWMKAMRMGGKWVKRDVMSNMVHVLKLKTIFEETMHQKWARFTKFHNEKVRTTLANGEDPGITGEVPPAPSTPVSAPSGKAAKGKAKPKGKGKAKARQSTIHSDECAEAADDGADQAVFHLCDCPKQAQVFPLVCGSLAP